MDAEVSTPINDLTMRFVTKWWPDQEFELHQNSEAQDKILQPRERGIYINLA